MKWLREPKDYKISEKHIEVTTLPHTDLWQRTYYHFRNDNAPVLQMETEDRFLLAYTHAALKIPALRLCLLIWS